MTSTLYFEILNIMNSVPGTVQTVVDLAALATAPRHALFAGSAHLVTIVIPVEKKIFTFVYAAQV